MWFPLFAGFGTTLFYHFHATVVYLAGEIKKPGSYSMRTLEFVRNMSKQEAELFTDVAKLAHQERGGHWVVFGRHDGWLETNRQINMKHNLILRELGILNQNDLILRFFPQGTEEQTLFSDNHVVIIRRGGIQSELQIPVWKFTETGQELLPLIQKPLDDEYIDYIGQYFLNNKGEYAVGEIVVRRSDGVGLNIVREKKFSEGDESNS
jgi:Protein of unknown function (DUF2806)